jgi:hypothetical protein
VQYLHGRIFLGLPIRRFALAGRFGHTGLCDRISLKPFSSKQNGHGRRTFREDAARRCDFAASSRKVGLKIFPQCGQTVGATGI